MFEAAMLAQSFGGHVAVFLAGVINGGSLALLLLLVHMFGTVFVRLSICATTAAAASAAAAAAIAAGAVRVQSGQLNISSSQVGRNRAVRHGGAIFGGTDPRNRSAHSTITLYNTTLDSNTAEANGGKPCCRSRHRGKPCHVHSVDMLQQLQPSARAIWHWPCTHILTSCSCIPPG
jgi:hypothetical protein